MIAEKIDEAYRKAQKPRGAWWPRASGCGGCLREMAHLLAGVEPRPNSAESERVFELGHQRGARLAEVAKGIWPDAQCELEIEVPIPGLERPMLGHIDLWIPSLRTIVDFKTAGSFKMGLLNGSYGPSAAKEGAGEDYEMQLQAYRHGMLVRSQLGSLERIRCLLVFEAKDSDARKDVTAGQLVEVEVPHTDELEARFQARLSALSSMIQKHVDGQLDPKTIQGMPDPSKYWRCKVKDGRSLYCSIGPITGSCK